MAISVVAPTDPMSNPLAAIFRLLATMPAANDDAVALALEGLAPPEPGPGPEGGRRPARAQRPRCGARCRSGAPCQAPCWWPEGATAPRPRCRMHGGASTGPRTTEGKAKIAAANRARRKLPHAA